jgi:hypothetical protein
MPSGYPLKFGLRNNGSSRAFMTQYIFLKTKILKLNKRLICANNIVDACALEMI